MFACLQLWNDRECVCVHVCLFVYLCVVLTLQVLGHLVTAVTSGVADSTGRPGVFRLVTPC